MQILFCAQCGIRVNPPEEIDGNVLCEDCLAGRPRRMRNGRRGDSAIIARPNGVLLKKLKMNSDKN